MGSLKGRSRERLQMRTKRKIKTFTLFRSFPTKEEETLFAAAGENFDCVNGALTCGVGTSACRMEGIAAMVEEGVQIKDAGYIRTKNGDGYKKDLVVIDQNDMASAYDFSSESFTRLKAFAQDSDVRMLDFVDKNKDFVKLFYGGTGAYAYKNGEFEHAYAGEIQSACVCNERVFLAIKPYTIIYSRVGEYAQFIENVDDSGQIFTMGEYGEIVEIQSLRDSVYIFLERGIFRLDVGGAAREFVRKEIPFCGGRVLKHSVKEVKDRLYFLTEKGAYFLDGKEVKKTCAHLQISPDKESDVSAVGFDDKYFVQYVDEHLGARVLALDLEGGGCEVFKTSVVCGSQKGAFTQIGNAIRILDGKGVLPANNAYRFLSDWNTFDGHEEKTLKKVTLYGKGQVVLVIRGENGKRKMAVDLTNGGSVFKVNLKSRKFAFEFFLEKGAEIFKMDAETEILKQGVK